MAMDVNDAIYARLACDAMRRAFAAAEEVQSREAGLRASLWIPKQDPSNVLTEIPNIRVLFSGADVDYCEVTLNADDTTSTMIEDMKEAIDGVRRPDAEKEG